MRARGLSRRDLIAGLVAGLCPTLLPRQATAKSPEAEGIVDVHHHFYAQPLKQFVESAASIRRMLEFSPAKSIELMDEAGVSTAILSTRFWLQDDLDAQRRAFTAAAREMNEHGPGS